MKPQILSILGPYRCRQATTDIVTVHEAYTGRISFYRNDGEGRWHPLDALGPSGTGLRAIDDRFNNSKSINTPLEGYGTQAIKVIASELDKRDLPRGQETDLIAINQCIGTFQARETVEYLKSIRARLRAPAPRTDGVIKASGPAPEASVSGKKLDII